LKNQLSKHDLELVVEDEEEEKVEEKKDGASNHSSSPSRRRKAQSSTDEKLDKLTRDLEFIKELVLMNAYPPKSKDE
jgi:hypothetical protein